MVVVAALVVGEVKIVEMRERGWYKGDFHAHIIHGEDFYKANR